MEMTRTGRSKFAIWTADRSFKPVLTCSESDSGASSMSEVEGDKADVDMKPSDPNDLTAYNLDTYDEEESRGAGKSLT